MAHLPNLITDLALILGAAAVITVLFKQLKQPLVLGYIIAGFLVGPHFHMFPTITDIENVKIWADIGVIFLLFGLGLEFSFKKLVKVGGTAAITAIIEVSAMLLLGYTMGRMLGWSSMDSLFMGGILGIASTTIIIRAFDELGVKSQKFTSVVMGVLVIEDLVAVVLLVLLSTVAVSQQFSGGEMISSVLKLAFFLVLWFLAGIFFIPTLLKKTQHLMNNETMLIVALALCLGMVILATLAGFSAALGAFIMGSILAETLQGKKIEHLLQPVKDLFGAVFFVSVGMLIDPQMMVTYIIPILIGTLLLLTGKPLFVIAGALISGQPLKTSVQSGMSLSQIGEFSFIIATLGLSLGVTADFLYPVAVAISVVTAFTTTYMIKFSEPFYNFLSKKLPQKWMAGLSRYSSGAQSINTAGNWKKVLRSYSINIIIYSVLIISIILLSTRFIQPFFHDRAWNSLLTVSVTLLLMAPFLWALSVKRFQKEAHANLWLKTPYRGPLIMLELLRMGLAIFFIGLLCDMLFSPATAFLVTLLIILLLITFSKKIQTYYNNIEARFLQNLYQKELTQLQPAEDELAPWDAHIAYFEVHPDAPLAGRTLEDLSLREKFGINIAMIERGSRYIMAPERNERLYPADMLTVIGTDEQLNAFRTYAEYKPETVNKLRQKKEVILKQLSIQQDSGWIGKTIRESTLREKTKGIIVGIERKGERMLNPPSSLVFEENDIVWIVGNVQRLMIIANEKR